MSQQCLPLHTPRICGNTNTGLLKLFALFLMITDHIGSAFFPGVMELRIIGRLAFPLYVWCCIVGVEYTGNHWKYAMRLFLFGLVSQPFYMWGLNHSLQELNVMFTLFFGVFSLICIKEKKHGSHIWGPCVALLAGCAMKMDYGFKGILLMLSLYAARKEKGALAAVFFCFCLYWGSESGTVYQIFDFRLPDAPAFLPYADSLFRGMRKLQFMAFGALPFMLWTHRGERLLHLPKWIGYAAYPAHLAIIALIRILLRS